MGKYNIVKIAVIVYIVTFAPCVLYNSMLKYLGIDYVGTIDLFKMSALYSIGAYVIIKDLNSNFM